MIQEELKWKSASGNYLAGRLWKPEAEPKAIIVLVHGFGEHCQRYTPYFKLFENNAFAFVAYDQMGHGASGGKRGAISSYIHLLDDVQECLEKAKELFPGIPVFIYGHSMGGNIVANFLIHCNPDVNGAIITSPWLKLTKGKGVFIEKIVSILSTFLPNFTVNSDLETKYISTLKNEVEAYEKDSLNHGKISFRLFNQIIKTGNAAIINSININIPTLLLHGTDDMITSPLASAKFANNSKCIKFIEWEKGYHELHNDFCREELVKTVVDWIKTKV